MASGWTMLRMLLVWSLLLVLCHDVQGSGKPQSSLGAKEPRGSTEPAGGKISTVPSSLGEKTPAGGPTPVEPSTPGGKASDPAGGKTPVEPSTPGGKTPAGPSTPGGKMPDPVGGKTPAESSTQGGKAPDPAGGKTPAEPSTSGGNAPDPVGGKTPAVPSTSGGKTPAGPSTSGGKAPDPVGGKTPAGPSTSGGKPHRGSQDNITRGLTTLNARIVTEAPVCDFGYEYVDFFSACVDIDECLKHNGRCSHICINTEPDYICACPKGLTLTKNERTCFDVDECAALNVPPKCPEKQMCVNFFGGYECMKYQLVNEREIGCYVWIVLFIWTIILTILVLILLCIRCVIVGNMYWLNPAKWIACLCCKRPIEGDKHTPFLCLVCLYKNPIAENVPTPDSKHYPIKNRQRFADCCIRLCCPKHNKDMEGVKKPTPKKKRTPWQRMRRGMPRRNRGHPYPVPPPHGGFPYGMDPLDPYYQMRLAGSGEVDQTPERDYRPTFPPDTD